MTRNKILFVQPFLLEKTHLSHEILIWSVYIENYLKTRNENLLFDLLYLPEEKKEKKINITSFNEKERFFSQMSPLVSDLNFGIDKNTIICISGTTSNHYLSSKLIAEYFQADFPETVQIFGGAHASACPNDFDYDNSPIDYVIKGEGEKSMHELINNNVKKQDKPVILPNNPIRDLNDLPPIEFSIFDKYIEKFNHLSISLSRGCPFSCNFCMEKGLSNSERSVKGWKAYSPRRAIQEVNSMIKFGKEHAIKIFGFYDPTFGLNKKWLLSFLDSFNFNEDDFSYCWVETRLDILNRELIKKFQQKRFFLMYGLESYSDNMLKIMNKCVNPREYLNKFEEIYNVHKEINAKLTFNILMNHPGETQESYAITYDRLEKLEKENDLDFFYFNIRFYHHFPGTVLYNKSNEFEKNYGTKIYFPEWWKNESLLKLGAYCVRPSRTLSLKESIDIYTERYIKLNELALMMMKKKRPANFLARGFELKKGNKFLNEHRIELHQFIDENITVNNP